MNEQAQKLLVSLVEKATNGIDAAVSFSQAQIPDVINQMLVWKMTTSIMWMIAALIVAAFTVAVCRGCFKHAKRIQEQRKQVDESHEMYKRSQLTYEEYRALNHKISERDANTQMTGAYVVCACTGLVGLCIFLACMDFDWLKILMAPKFYLVEYATTLVK